jgi:hypothetical protein
VRIDVTDDCDGVLRIQKNNTLGAEVDLGGRATVVRKNQNGIVITDADQLIKCSQYGNPKRNSDPTVRS